MTAFIVENLDSVCRLCLNVGENLTSMFEKADDDVSLAQKVSELFGIQIENNDEPPSKLCEQCRSQIDTFDNFKHMVIESHNILSSQNRLIIVKQVNESAANQSIPKVEIIQIELQDVEIENENDNMKLLENENCASDEELRKLDIGPTVRKALKDNQCLLCLEQFTEARCLREHVNSHVQGTLLDAYYLVSDKNVLCRACGKKFDFRFSYIEHQRQHLNIKPFTCKHEGCRNTFHTRTMLKHHLQLHASRSFQCSRCGQGFKRKSELRSHEIIHQDEGLLFTCAVCDKQYKNRLTLRAHCKMHNQQPKHKCPNCTKLFYSHSEMKRHTLSHSNEKMFICTSCDRAYSAKSALLRHCREHCNSAVKNTDITITVRGQVA